jgi:hypothetical protein
MKTKRIINISVAALLVIVLLWTLCWFYVRGATLRVLKAIPSDCEITVTAMYWDGTTDNREEFVLSQEQATALLELLQSTNYWRDLSTTIMHNEPVTYEIFCLFDLDSQQEMVHISCAGGYAIAINSSVDKWDEDGFLRIINKTFLSQLESIFAS